MLGKEKKGGVITLKDTWQGGWGRKGVDILKRHLAAA